MDIATLFFGMFMPIFVFTVAKAYHQTRRIYRHTRSFHNAYLYLVWVEAAANFIFSVTTMLFIQGVIPAALWYYILAVFLWTLQVQILPQIIANRVSLIMVNKRKASYLKWGLFALISPVTVAVCYIWVIAHVDGATDVQVRTNVIFEKCEKTFFLVVDLALNIYFLYLVRFNLIAAGLNKYWRLFNWNVGMVAISTTLDGLLLGFLSLSNQFIYVQFAPLAYISKLYIELVMARLISVVVRSTGNQAADEGTESGSWGRSQPTVKGGGHSHNRDRSGHMMDKLSMNKSKPATVVREGSSGSDIHLANYGEPQGITKMVETTVEREYEDDDFSTSTVGDTKNRGHGRPVGMPDDRYKHGV